MRAFIIADDAAEAQVLAFVLQRAGLPAVAQLSRACCSADPPPACIMLAVSDTDPRELLPAITVQPAPPIIVIVERLTEALHGSLLDAGAALVLTRPYSAGLLTRQVTALLRIAGAAPAAGQWQQAGVLRLDAQEQTVQIADRPPQHLTRLEYRLLACLLRHAGQVLSADQLVDQV